MTGGTNLNSIDQNELKLEKFYNEILLPLIQAGDRGGIELHPDPSSESYYNTSVKWRALPEDFAELPLASEESFRDYLVKRWSGTKLESAAEQVASLAFSLKDDTVEEAEVSDLRYMMF